MADIDNLKIQQQINAAIAERSRLLSAQTSMISDQVELAASFCKAMKCEGIDGISERISEIRAGLETAQHAANGATDGIDGMRGGLDGAAGGAGDLANAIDGVESSTGGMSGAMDTAMTAMTGGWSKIASLIGGIPSLLKSVGEGIFNIGKALLGPLSALNDLMMAAASDLANDTSMANAREKVRAQYGDLNKGIAKDIVTSQGDVKAAFKEAGLSAAAVFGPGPQGAADMLLATLELSKELGPAVNLLGDGFKKSAGPLLVLQKGLGLAGEDLKAMVQNAKAMGEDVTKTLQDVAKISEAMVDKFGGSAKEYAKDIAYMKAQSASFGKMTTAQMAASSVAVRKYGMELKDIVGIGKAFEDFEGAAEKSAQLAQMFGAYVDPIKMMKEEDPAKQFEMLRKSMQQAGQSAETMNKAQIKALATQTGMDENMVRLAFSSKNAGKSLGDIQKESEKAGKKQMSQAEIMEKMGKNIERVVVRLETKSTGFFDTLMSGFTKGFTTSGPFRAAIGDMSKALAAVYEAGKELGDLFANVFPGMTDILGGLGDKATSTGSTITSMVSFVKDLFRGLKTDPAKAMEVFNKKVLDYLDNMFKPGGSTGWIGRLMNGVKEFTKALANIAGGLIKLVGDAVKKGVTKLVEFIKKPKEIAPNGAQSKSFISEIFGPIWDGLKDAIPKIFDSLVELALVTMTDVIPNMFNKLTEMIKESGPILGGGVQDLLPRLEEAFIKVFDALVPLVGAIFDKVVPAMFDLLNAAFDKSADILKAGFDKTFGSVLEGTIEDKTVVGAGNAWLKAGPKVAGAAAKVFGQGTITKAIGKALIGPWGQAALLAVGASKIDKEIGPALQKKLESGEIKNKGSVAGGKIAATIVDGATFGLLSPESLAKVADGVAGLTDKVLEGIKKFAPDVAEALNDLLGGFFDVFAGVGDVLMGFFTADSDKIAGGLKKLVSGLFDMLKGSLGMIGAMFSDMIPIGLDMLAKVGKMLFRGIGALIRSLVIMLGEGLYALGEGIFKFFTDASFRTEMLEKIASLFTGALDAIVSTLGNILVSAVGFLTDSLAGLIEGLFDIKLYEGSSADLFRSLFDMLELRKIWDSILNFVNLAFGWLGNAIWETADFIIEYFIFPWDNIYDFLMEWGPSVFEWLTSTFDSVVDSLISVGKTVFEWVTWPFRTAWEFISGIGPKFIDFIADMGQKAIDFGKGIVDGIVNGLVGIYDAIVGPVKEAWQAAKDWLGISSPSKEAMTMGEQVVDGMDKGLEKMPEVTGNATEEAVGAMKDSVNALDPAALSKAGESLAAFKEIANAVGGIGDTSGLDAISKLIGSLSSLFSNIPLGSDADVERAPKAMAALVGGLDSVLTTVGTKLSTLLPQMKTALGGITAAEVEALKPQLEFVTSLMEMIGKFSSAVQENQLTPEQVEALQDAQEEGTIIPDGFDELIKKLGGFIGKLSEEGGLISKFKSLQFDPAVMTAAVTFTTDVLTLTEKFKDVMSAAIDSKSVLESDPGFIFTGLETLNTRAKGFIDGGGIANLGATLGTLEKLTATVGGFKTQYGEGVATYLNAAVADMNELDKVLSKIEINDLDTTIDNMNGKLIVKRQNFEFSHKPVHVTINMQVSFKAESFTKDIFKVAADIVKKEDLPDIGTLSNEKYIESQKR